MRDSENEEEKLQWCKNVKKKKVQKGKEPTRRV